jgi:spectinomycin phosphotransferase
VTVSDLAAPWAPDLSAAMHTAAWLAREAGLEFVVAPVLTRAGQLVGSLDSRHALMLFPYLDAAPSRFEEPIKDGDRAAIIDLLATLHTVAPTGIQVPSRPLELASRQAIDRALASLDVPGRAVRTPSRAVIL